MIRLILVAIGVFILWVLFLCEFSKRQKITICVAAILISITAMWFEQSSQTPKEGVISVNQIVDCGVTSQHTYRTNYDVKFCLRNISSKATAKRVGVNFSALNCTAGNCAEIQVINKDVALSLEPEEQTVFNENLNFDKVDASLDSIVWVAKVVSVKALD